MVTGNSWVINKNAITCQHLAKHTSSSCSFFFFCIVLIFPVINAELSLWIITLFCCKFHFECHLLLSCCWVCFENFVQSSVHCVLCVLKSHVSCTMFWRLVSVSRCGKKKNPIFPVLPKQMIFFLILKISFFSCCIRNHQSVPYPFENKHPYIEWNAAP